MKNLKNSLLLLAALLMIGLSGCEDGDEINPEENELQLSRNGTVTAKVNGEDFSSELNIASKALINNDDSTPAFSFLVGSYKLENNNQDTTALVLTFFSNDLANSDVGTLSYPTISTYISFSSADDIRAVAIAYTGTELEITSHDESQQTVSGTFSFEGFGAVGGGVSVTEGVFTNIKYTIDN